MTGGGRTVVLGAGGHAVVCIDSLLASGHDVVGTVAAERPERVIQVPHLGRSDVLPRLLADGIRHAFVAIGDNRTRARVMAEVRDLGFDLVNTVSPAAVVATTAQLGANVAVMAGAVVNAYARLGDGVVLNTGATVDHDAQLGPCVHVAPGCHLAGSVVVGEGVFLGMGSIVVPSTTIGAWSRTGAGAVVVRDLDGGVLAVGVPARARTGS